MQTITFSPFDNNFLKFYQMLDNYRLNNIEGKLKDNYNHARFNLDKMIALSITYDQDNILFFSSIFRRPEWHPSVVRLLNRTYKDVSVRVKTGNAFEKMQDQKPITKFLEQQFEFAKNLGYTNFIVSRENKSKNVLNFYTTWCEETTKVKWHYYDEKVWTCPQEYGQSCNQNIIYASLKNNFNPTIMLS